jgi:hypothetical protein
MSKKWYLMLNEFRADMSNDRLVVTNLKYSLKKAQSLVQRYVKKQNLADKLKKLREEDAKHDQSSSITD